MESQDNSLPTAPKPPEQETYDKSAEPSVPNSEWPGAFGLLKYSKKTVKTNFSTILALVLVYFGANIVLSAFDNVGHILSGIVSIIVEVALVSAYLASGRGQKMEFNDAIKTSKPMLWLKYFVNSLATSFLLLVSFILLIVPFFFVLPRLVLAVYFLVDKNQGPLEAIGSSWNATKGHSGKMWGIIGAGIVMALPIITIIGIPFSIYFLFFYQAAFALAYLYITKQPATNPMNKAAP